MPQGTGKTVRIAVFAEGEQAEAATAAGADVVGMDELADSMKKGDLNFDVVIAAPDAMRVVGALGPVLGPRGLMPNPKVGTVSADVGKAVSNAKAGQVQFRNDKAGIIHCSVGKATFETAALIENINSLLDALNKAKPSTAKGQFIKHLTVSTTMGPGIRVDRASLSI
jgi:large subunit ribosomal protein L1